MFLLGGDLTCLYLSILLMGCGVSFWGSRLPCWALGCSIPLGLSGCLFLVLLVRWPALTHSFVWHVEMHH
jgi:hypothetical protein